jgi:hypothetical protein
LTINSTENAKPSIGVRQREMKRLSKSLSRKQCRQVRLQLKDHKHQFAEVCVLIERRTTTTLVMEPDIVSDVGDSMVS